MWAIRRDPDVWENPLDFAPKRFLSGRNARIDPDVNDFELIPFGARRRICPGTRMGIVLVEYMVGTMIYCLGPLVNKILTSFHHHVKPPTSLGASSSTSEDTANSTNSKPNIDHQKLRNGYLPEKSPNFNQVPPERSGGRWLRTAQQGRPENTHQTQCTEATACTGRRPTHARPHVISGRSCRALGQTPDSSPPTGRSPPEDAPRNDAVLFRWWIPSNFNRRGPKKELVLRQSVLQV
ncbi:hypothetical protein NL676_031350 [Syzygium grande]|nr:hypothetical protein NL676_031350 [Syzygium grande]